MYIPAQIQLKMVKMVEIEPESDVPTSSAISASSARHPASACAGSAPRSRSRTRPSWSSFGCGSVASWACLPADDRGRTVKLAWCSSSWCSGGAA